MRKLLGFMGLMGLMGLLPVEPFLPIEPIIHAQDTNRLSLHVEGASFFVNNEYFGPHTNGYTLPGFYLRPHVLWQIEPRVSLEVGAHWLHYWGAHQYPAGTSFGPWPEQDDSLTSRAHILPWFRAEVAFKRLRSFVLTVGNLHYEQGHRLPLPLYNPERLYAADPEAGAQLQVDIKHLIADVWVDWHEFIWQHSTRQERFTFGLSARPYFCIQPDWPIYMPILFIAQHVGGQALRERQPVQNHFNAAIGLGSERRGLWWDFAAEVYLMGYSQSNAPGISFSRGHALYPTLRATYDRSACLEVGYWHGTGFVPLLGSPLFSCISTVDGTVFDHCRLLTMGASYRWQQFKHCNLVLEGRYYHYIGEEKATQYSFGIELLFNPTLTLLR